MVIVPASTAELTRLVNHPKIKPATGLPEDCEISLAGYYENEGNCAFSCQHGAMLFVNEGDGVFDSHFLFIPGSPATEIKENAKAMIREMFTKHGARVITGHPPRDNRAVRVIGTAIGYQKIPDQSFIDAQGRDCEIYEIRKDQWAHL